MMNRHDHPSSIILATAGNATQPDPPIISVLLPIRPNPPPLQHTHEQEGHRLAWRRSTPSYPPPAGSGAADLGSSDPGSWHHVSQPQHRHPQLHAIASNMRTTTGHPPCPPHPRQAFTPSPPSRRASTRADHASSQSPPRSTPHPCWATHHRTCGHKDRSAVRIAAPGRQYISSPTHSQRHVPSTHSALRSPRKDWQQSPPSHHHNLSLNHTDTLHT